MRTSIETITPETAAQWLAMNSHNRNLKDSYILRMSEAIKRGEWVLNGESIKFNGGTLVDGQHRLAAIVKANQAIESVVVWDVPIEAQETIDTGSRRTLSDILKLRGEGNYTALSSALTFVYRSETGNLNASATRTYPTAQEALAVLDRHPNLRNSLTWGDRMRKHFRVSSAMVAWLHYTFATIDSEDAEDFFDKWLHGVGLDVGSPILALRSSVERDTTGQNNRKSSVARAAYVIKAWNAYREGRPVALLKWTPGGKNAEAFPVPV